MDIWVIILSLTGCWVDTGNISETTYSTNLFVACYAQSIFELNTIGQKKFSQIKYRDQITYFGSQVLIYVQGVMSGWGWGNIPELAISSLFWQT